MKGEVFSLNISRKKGTVKLPVPSASFKEDFGVEGDAHAGLLDKRQVSLLSWERIQEKNFCRKKTADRLRPGDFAENITTQGLDLSSIKLGDLFQVGEVTLKVSQIGKECHRYCEIYKKVGDCIMPREGIFARVLKGGKVRKGDAIELIPKGSIL